jgi:diadenosine tetraphosphate (Ap4A) HIT family hydrolase
MQERCLLCLGSDGDPIFERLQVWEDGLWRLTVSLDAEIAGMSYLEPKRHIPHITDLDGEEARTLGIVLGKVSKSLRAATGANQVFLHVFGGHINHLHFFLVPHRPGDGAAARIVEGEYEIERRIGGATRWGSRVYPKLARKDLESVAERIRTLLGDKH